jgi:hypothetical protein
MKTKYITAIMLIMLGIVVLASSGIANTTLDPRADDLDPQFRTTYSHSFPPIVGVLPLIGGIIVLVSKPTRALGTESARVTKPALAANGRVSKHFRRLVPTLSKEGLSHGKYRADSGATHLRNRYIDASDDVRLSPSEVG